LNRPSNLPALSLHDVSVAYDDKIVLSHLSLAVAPGEFVGVVGPNGAGKSTLLNALLGMVSLRAGKILIYGLPIARSRGRVAFMPQREAVDWTFPVVVDDVVMMGRQTRLGFGRRPAAKDREVVGWALAQMQMLDQRHTPIGSLSGGQQQRVFLARALAQEGDVLLLDEPLTGVDTTTQETILRLLQGFQRAGRTVVMTTHDLGVARAFCSKVLFINRVAIAYGSPAETFTPAVLRETYGGHLVRLGGVGASTGTEGIEPSTGQLVASSHAHGGVEGIEPSTGILDESLFILQDEAHHAHDTRTGTH
jgi:manganese/zinc/iron transport system ATP- binding protein